MKKIIACLMAVLMMTAALTACGRGNGGADNGENADRNDGGEKLQIVTTIFPQYDWVRQILGEGAANAELTLLQGSGVDLHSYQPTTDDMIKISSCDLFLYTGGESDAWVEDALATAQKDDRIVISLLEVLGDAVKKEEIIEGTEHDHDDEENHEHGELDEHVWLSLRHAGTLCGYIADRLAELDPDHADIYTANAAAYTEQLAALDADYQEAVNSAPVKTLLFADRFPFRYLVDDYDLNYYAAFSGCSAETEASFETIVFLAEKVNELNLKHIMVIESSDQSIARTVIQSTGIKNQQILVLNSLQSVTVPHIASGASYLSIMERNLEVLKEALK